MDYIGENKELYELNLELSKNLHPYFDAEYDIPGKREAFGAFMITKAYKTHKAILLLAENGFGEDAIILVRSLFEINIILNYINKDNSGNMLNRYIDHDWILRREMLEAVSRDKGKNLSGTNLTAFEEDEKNGSHNEIIRKSDEMQKKYNFDKRYKWSDKSIAKMAEDIGQENQYLTVYKLQSMFSHTNSRGMNEYVDESLLFNLDPSDNLVEQALASALDNLIEIVKGVSDIFKWDTIEMIRGIESKLNQILKNTLQKPIEKSKI